MAEISDIVIIGSGIGGATIAAGLAPSMANITILEAGGFLVDRPENRDPRAIFQKGFFRPDELWYTRSTKGTLQAFNPGNYYYVGGNSKFYGAVLTRYRNEDFEEIVHFDGVSPAWPYSYDELEPWYCKAEQLFQVRGSLNEDPTEPYHSHGYAFPPVPDEACIADIRAKLKDHGLHPYSLPLGVDYQKWLKKAKTPWDAYPNCDDGKMDAQTASLKAALCFENVKLITNAPVFKLETDDSGKNIIAAYYRHQGEAKVIKSKIFILAAGAVRSAALLLASKDDKNPDGLANKSDQVGRNFMNHNASAVIGIRPFWKNTAVYQKTFGINDFYVSGGDNNMPLGNIQLLGRVDSAVLKGSFAKIPQSLLRLITDHAIDFYAMSEDLPSPDSRVTVDGDRIFLNWVRSNWTGHQMLVQKLKHILKEIGFPIVLSKPFDRRTPSHQCGTIRIGNDAKSAPLNIWGQAFDHPNLYVSDASILPTSAAVNPALTIAAHALRTANHIISTDLKS